MLDAAMTEVPILCPRGAEWGTDLCDKSWIYTKRRRLEKTPEAEGPGSPRHAGRVWSVETGRHSAVWGHHGFLCRDWGWALAMLPKRRAQDLASQVPLTNWKTLSASWVEACRGEGKEGTFGYPQPQWFTWYRKTKIKHHEIVTSPINMTYSLRALVTSDI